VRRPSSVVRRPQPPSPDSFVLSPPVPQCPATGSERRGGETWPAYRTRPWAGGDGLRRRRWRRCWLGTCGRALMLVVGVEDHQADGGQGRGPDLQRIGAGAEVVDHPGADRGALGALSEGLFGRERHVVLEE